MLYCYTIQYVVLHCSCYIGTIVMILGDWRDTGHYHDGIDIGGMIYSEGRCSGVGTFDRRSQNDN